MPNATSYWVALVDAAQLRVGVADTPVAALTGVGPLGAAAPPGCQAPDRTLGRSARALGDDLPEVFLVGGQRGRLIGRRRLVGRDDRGRIGGAERHAYCVAFVEAAQLRVGVNATPVAPLTGVGPVGAVGAGGGGGVSVVALAGDE